MKPSKKIEQRSKLKRLAVDILGVLLIIAAGITGPLPGPGGIPILVLGLSLLATNHEWAERLLELVKQHSGKLAGKLFSSNPATRWIIDILAIVLITLAVLLLSYFTHSIARSAAVSLSLAALVLLLGNRQRGSAIKRHVTKHKHK